MDPQEAASLNLEIHAQWLHMFIKEAKQSHYCQQCSVTVILTKMQVKVKVKVKVKTLHTKHHAMKIYWVSGCIAPYIL